MSLRNPNLPTDETLGTSYPLNVYEIGVREIIPVDVDTVNVKILLGCYTDSNKTYKIHETGYTLIGLTSDSALLSPALYQTKLLEQHGTEELDGTLLENFEVLS